jgi:flagellar biosynthesis regulator FlbT
MLGINGVMIEFAQKMFRRKSETFVASVRRSEVGMRLKPGVEQIIMEGNTVVASAQQQHQEVQHVLIWYE